MNMSTSNPYCIAFDWGTSSLRAYLLNSEGLVLADSRSELGVLKPQNFSETVTQICEPWDAAFGRLPCFASGMIGSQQGWIDAGYASTPTNFKAIAQGAKDIFALAHRKFWIVPGVKHIDSATKAVDVMRGEETQVFGACVQDEIQEDIQDDFQEFLAVLPGTHSKWVQVRNGTIVNFKTFMTGETYALFRQHSILSKLMSSDSSSTLNQNVFLSGAQQSLNAPSDLLHQLFTVRTKGLFNQLKPTEQADYLSGLLIGNEIASAKQIFAGNIHLIGETALVERYELALKCAGLQAKPINPSTPPAAKGLFAIAKQVLH
jgi:2-dehydro-3-deoxygalactonokinase